MAFLQSKVMALELRRAMPQKDCHGVCHTPPCLERAKEEREDEESLSQVTLH